MPRGARADERQANLFGWAEEAPVPPAPRRARKPAPEPAAAEPESAATFAERASEAELDELVAALPDDALAHLTLASARQLKRRIGRSAKGRRPAKGRPGPLERAGQDLAREWAARADPDEAW